MADAELGQLFANALPNTLDTTVDFTDGDGAADDARAAAPRRSRPRPLPAHGAQPDGHAGLRRRGLAGAAEWADPLRVPAVRRRLPVPLPDPRQLLADEVAAALPTEGVLPYETDGYGNALYMDDANVPSLLSLTYLGCLSADDPRYRATRAFVLRRFTRPWFAWANSLFGELVLGLDAQRSHLLR